MAVIRDTYKSSDGTGRNPSNREELSDIISDISPTDTPFITAVGKGTTTSVYKEWQLDELRQAGPNAKAEGADADEADINDTTRVGNYTQISDGVAKVSGTQKSVDNAGYSDSMAYEMAKVGLEIRNDMEFIMVQGDQSKFAGSGGTSATPRLLGSLQSWLGSGVDSEGTPLTGADNTGNSVIGVGDSGVKGDGSDTNDDVGTAYPWSEAILELMIDNCYQAGGKPNVLMVNPSNKRITNSFTGRANAVQDVTVNTESISNKISNSVDLYDSDYGSFMIVPNRQMRSSEAYLLQTDMFSVDYLRDFQTIPLAVKGDSEENQVITEYTLSSTNQKSSAAAYNLG